VVQGRDVQIDNFQYKERSNPLTSDITRHVVLLPLDRAMMCTVGFSSDVEIFVFQLRKYLDKLNGKVFCYINFITGQSGTIVPNHARKMREHALYKHGAQAKDKF
jgi:hypothetical protein